MTRYTWGLWIDDSELFARSKANEALAKRLLLADWHEKSKYSNDWKEWYQRVAKIIENTDAAQ